jgi:hypothetical protein
LKGVGYSAPVQGAKSNRTAFGKLDLACPRLYSQCRCGARVYASDSFNPLAVVLVERTYPELLYLQARWASNLSHV